MDGLRAWARQPTTVAGFSAGIAGLTAVVLQQLTWAQVVPVLAGAAMSIILPDNTVAQQQARELAGEIVTKINIGKAST